MVGKVLADYGAQVIAIESEEQIRKGFGSRHPGSGAADLTSLNLGNIFNKFNTNKLSFSLNLRYPEAQEVARNLVKVSHVVITSFLPGALKRLGISYEELVKVKPDIIMLTMPAFGIEGPYKGYRTLSWNLLAMCGFDHMTTSTGRSPIRASPYSHPDTSSQPFHGMVALLAALNHWFETGKGQLIELSQYESTLNFTETLVFDYLVNGRLRKPPANKSHGAAPQGVYCCKGDDQWCAIAVFTDREWESLCSVVGREDLLKDARFTTAAGRESNSDELDAIINGWTVDRVSWEVMDRMQAAGVASGVVENVEDIMRRDPQLKARRHWIKIKHPDAGEMTVEDWAFKLSGVPDLKWRHAPLLGEHRDYVCSEVLGMTEQQINDLIVKGVFS